MDDAHLTFFKVKIYDKILDLVGRDFKKMIGSRFREVVCSKRKKDDLQLKIMQAKHTSATGLEISFYFGQNSDLEFG
jgi:hypothetical protein